MRPADEESGASTEQWRRLDELFDQALAIDPNERQDWVDKACGEDRELRRKVWSLLQADEEATGFLEHSPTLVGGLAPLPPPSHVEPEEPVPETLGHYRVLRSLGRGGSSRVYLAERNDTYRQKVAVKVLRVAGSDELAARFVRERQILAGLDHPHIAKILDGGTTPSGSPYLVMEYVEGRPIDRYCRQRNLGVRAVVELFLGVLDAVEHAHRNLIVHRDVKPGNVLVRDDGQPRLVDFGIAKLLNSQVAGGYDETRADLLLLTPSHASPEQITGRPISTASDIYSLGVLLYGLLCGSSPYEVDTGSVHEMVTAICDHEPPTASRRAAAAGHAERAKELRGDLDHILACALAKRPEDRYRSADRFADDLRRYLDGLPVLARTGSLGYRFGKFLRRNRLPVSLAALLVVLVGAFMVNTVVQSERIESALGVAEQERARANREAETARNVSDFLVDLFRYAEPGTVGGKDLSARELLARGVEDLDSESLDDRPLVRAELRATIGHVYWKMGLYPESETLYRQALASQREILPAGDPRLGATLNALALPVIWQGRYDEAQTFLEEAVAIREAALGQEHLATAESWNDLGIVHELSGRPEEAERLYRRALDTRLRLLPADDLLIAESLNNLANLLSAQKDFVAAEPMSRRALEIRRTALGARHPSVAEALNNTAAILEKLGQIDEAEAMYREGLSISEEVLGSEHPVIGTFTHNLSQLLIRQGRVDEAGPLIRRCLDVREKILAPDHPLMARSFVGYARWLIASGEPDEARAVLRRALEIFDAKVEPAHRWRVDTVQLLEELDA